MPTGYTAKLVESGQTFSEFVMGCARAFGACIDMRDDPTDVPIPEKFDPSPYHTKALRAAKSELTRLKKYTAKQKKDYGQKQRAAEIKTHEGYIRKTDEENARIQDMIGQVAGWTPPTPEHEEMKKFMLQQLNISLGSKEWSEKELARAIARKPLEYYEAALRDADRHTAYHIEELGKEIARTNGRTEWIQKLRESLKKEEV